MTQPRPQPGMSMSFSTIDIVDNDTAFRFLNSQSMTNLVHGLNLNYSQIGYDRLVREIMTRWKDINNANLDNLGGKALRSLFEINMHVQHNGSIRTNGYIFERKLADAFISHFSNLEAEKRPNYSHESNTMFLELFQGLNCKSLTHRQLSDICELEQCKQLRATNQEVCDRLIQGFAAARDPTTSAINQFEPKMNVIPFYQLDQGLRVDVKDCVGYWYTGTILDKTPNSVYVCFDGFPVESNEWISNNECATNPRFSRLGSMTNNQPHVDIGYCACVSCAEKCLEKRQLIIENERQQNGMKKIYNYFKGLVTYYLS